MKQYQEIMQSALLGVVREILQQVATGGLNGEQHFYITFQTNGVGVIIPDFLKQSYPHEMTIVLQHQFDELTVTQDHFSVLLGFNGKTERLVIPFSSLIYFTDPSEDFGLHFTPQMNEQSKSEQTENTPAQIIDLNAIRNKK